MSSAFQSLCDSLLRWSPQWRVALRRSQILSLAWGPLHGALKCSTQHFKKCPHVSSDPVLLIELSLFSLSCISLIPHESVFLRLRVCFPICCCPPLPLFLLCLITGLLQSSPLLLSQSPISFFSVSSTLPPVRPLFNLFVSRSSWKLQSRSFSISRPASWRFCSTEQIRKLILPLPAGEANLVWNLFNFSITSPR